MSVFDIFMEDNQITLEKNEQNVQLSFDNIKQVFLKHKRDFYIVLPIAFVISCIIAFSIPNYFNCEVTLVPEASIKTSSSGVLGSLASSFGITLGSSSSGSDALGPSLYPDMMKSNSFIIDLFPIQVRQEEDDEPMSYYSYLLNDNQDPWFKSPINSLKSGILSLIGRKKELKKDTIVNPFKLLPEQLGVIGTIRKKIKCDTDDENGVISITVTDQSPLVAATIADSVKSHLQQAITAYRTSKARVDLEYNRKIYKEVRAKYDKAKQAYADYYDTNKKIFTQKSRTQLKDLQNEMDLQYQTYSSIVAQVQAAEAKVQEDTPAFTIIQGATIPLFKAGPKRPMIVFAICFLAFFFLCIYALQREHYLIPLSILILGLDNENEIKNYKH